MKIILTPELAEQFGKCEVCGEQATHIVRDILEEYRYGAAVSDKVSALLNHKFCEDHVRDPEVVQIQRDPQYDS